MSKLRIKYKMLKREFENVLKKNRPATVMTYPRKVETIWVTKIFTKEGLPFLNERRIRNLLVEEMREEIGNHMEITSEPSTYVAGGVMYKGRLRLVREED